MGAVIELLFAKPSLFERSVASVFRLTITCALCLTRGNPPIQGLWLLSALEPGTICIRKHLWTKTSVSIGIRNLFVLGTSVTICIRKHLWTKTS